MTKEKKVKVTPEVVKKAKQVEKVVKEEQLKTNCIGEPLLEM